MFSILFLGDIVGSPGRRIVTNLLPKIKKQYQIDLCIVNAENSAHGKGITPKIYHQLLSVGADVITLGNHGLAKAEIIPAASALPQLIFPCNIAGDYHLNNHVSITTPQGQLVILNILGEVFMHNTAQSPYQIMQHILKTVPADMYFVDFHGEATAEKQLFLHLFKKYCIAIVGTHTHVTTADEMVLDGCAYISDVGMCGVKHSILGRSIDEVIQQNRGEKTHYTVAKGLAMLNGVIIDIYQQQAISIRRINLCERN